MSKIRQEAYKNGQLVFEEVPDISKPNSFDHVFEKHTDLTGVLHLASPFHFKINKIEELLDPAVNGTRGVLSAAAKSGKITRVVVMSSVAAVVDPSKGDWPEKVYTEDDWLPLTYDQVLKSGDQRSAYLLSKKYAELEAWNFVKEHKPSFDLVTINPPMVFGPIAHHINHLSELNESVAQIWHRLKDTGDKFPYMRTSWFVDVRDLSLVVILALETQQAGGNRYLTAAGPWTYQYVAKIASENFADKYKGPRCEDESQLFSKGFSLNCSKVKNQLGIQFRPAEETFIDMISQLYDFESQGL